MPNTIGSYKKGTYALIAALVLALFSCGFAAAADQEATPEALVAAYQQLLSELKSDDVDYAAVLDGYRGSLQPLVQARDAEEGTPTNHDGEITVALEAARDGNLPPDVARQIFDKLTQKVFYQSVKHELRAVTEHWNDIEAGLAEIDEAEAFYAALAGTVEKREAAYEVNLLAPIEGAFDALRAAVRAKSRLDFDLARQVVDKTLMRTFYLAVGGNPSGYVFKIEDAVATGDYEHAKVMQAEGWAFYQSIYAYLRRGSAYDADHILEKLDLRSDVRAIDGDDLNRHFLHAVVGIANHEYDESMKSWGEDRAVVTALEGALFITMIETDLTALLGEEAYAALAAGAQGVIDAARSQNQALAQAHLASVRQLLESAIK